MFLKRFFLLKFVQRFLLEFLSSEEAKITCGIVGGWKIKVKRNYQNLNFLYKKVYVENNFKLLMKKKLFVAFKFKGSFINLGYATLDLFYNDEAIR